MATVVETPAVQSPAAAPRGNGNAPAPHRPKPKPTDGHRRDPQRPAAGKGGDLDFDDPSMDAEPAPSKRAAAPAKKAATPAKKPAAADNGRRTAPPAEKTRPNRVQPPEATGANQGNELNEGVDADAEDPYEKLARRYDVADGKKPAKNARKPIHDDDSDTPTVPAARTPKKPETSRRAAPPVEQDDDEDAPPADDDADADAELEVGDEIDDDGETTAEHDDETDLFTHPLLREAKEYGFTEEEAREFGTPEALQKAMTVLDRRYREIGAGKIPASVNDPAGKTPADGSATSETLPAGQAAATGKPPAQPPATEKLGDGVRHFKKLTIEDVDPTGFFAPETHTALSKVIDHYDGLVNDALGKLGAQTEQFDGFQKHIQERERTRFAEEQDDFFDSLGDDYSEVFGKGPLDDLDPDGAEAKNRLQFTSEMSELAKGLVGEKKSLPSRRKLRARVLRGFQAAVEKRESKIRQEAVTQERRRNKQRIAEPTSRARVQRDLTPDEAAGQFADEFYAKKGYKIDPRMEDDDDGV